MNTFSIIIPHKNIPELLQRCLNSIPDIEDIQVIVVDDNSEEGFVDFNNFPGNNRNYTTCFFDKKGKGAGAARNIGLKHATGKWVVFADADDFFNENFYQIIKSQENSEAQIVLFKAESVDSITLENSDRHLTLNKNIDLAIKGEVSNRDAVLSMPVPWCKMFNKQFVDENNISFDETICANDVIFVVKAACWAKNIIVSEKVLYTVTMRSGSLFDQTKTSPDNYLCRMSVYIRRNKFYNKYHIPKKVVLGYVWNARKLGLKTFLKAFWLAVKTNSLFSGFKTLLNIIKSHIS